MQVPGAGGRGGSLSPLPVHSPSLQDPYPHVSEPCRRSPVPHVSHLSGFTLTTVWCPPHLPVIPVGYGIAGIPELRGYTRVGRVFYPIPQLSLFDLPTDLGSKLKIDSLIINGPAASGAQKQALFGIRDHVLQSPISGFKVDIRHPNQRKAVPSVGAHGPVALFSQERSCFPRGQ